MALAPLSAVEQAERDFSTYVAQDFLLKVVYHILHNVKGVRPEVLEDWKQRKIRYFEENPTAERFQQLLDEPDEILPTPIEFYDYVAMVSVFQWLSARPEEMRARIKVGDACKKFVENPQNHFRLDGLPISSLPKEFFIHSAFRALARLSLLRQGLQVCPPLEFFSQLRAIDLENNQIEEIPFLQMPELMDFCASHNRIRAADFSGCPKLQAVNLNHNALMGVPLFANNVALFFLGLNNNRIANVQRLPGTCDGAEVDLRNNPFDVTNRDLRGERRIRVLTGYFAPIA